MKLSYLVMTFSFSTLFFSVHFQTFPVVFCIMESKKKAAYGRFFDYLRNDLASGWAPEEGSADYEVALRWGMTTRYPLMQIIGCYFHFTQVSTPVAKLDGLG